MQEINRIEWLEEVNRLALVICIVVAGTKRLLMLLRGSDLTPVRRQCPRCAPRWSTEPHWEALPPRLQVPRDQQRFLAWFEWKADLMMGLTLSKPPEPRGLTKTHNLLATKIISGEIRLAWSEEVVERVI